MSRKLEGTGRSQAGFSLIWVVAVIVILALLGAEVLNLSTKSVTNEMMLTFDTQARLLAESGVNYACAYAADILSGAQANALTALNGQTLNTGLPTGQQITLTVTVSPTNAYDYYVTSVGTVNQGSDYEADYSVTNVINAPPNGTGIYIVQSKPGTAIASPSSVSVNASDLTNFTAGISFDPRFAGAGNVNIASANFSGGIGSLNNGLRAYFTFDISSGSNADGFVFALKNGTWNGPLDAGGPQAGISHGAMLGYAGPGYPQWGHGLGLRPPKLGVEFDIYQNPGYGGISDGDGRNDPDNHHIANIFWGTTWTIGNNAAVAPTNTYLTSSSYAYDDNVHNIGSANNAAHPAPFNPTTGDNDPGGSGLPGLLSINRTTMVGTASPVPVRIEIWRPSAVVSNNVGNAYYNMYAYTIKTWYNCTAANCSNMGADYAPAATIEYTLYLTATEHTEFQKFVYGYQVSTGASTGAYNFSIPKIGMR
jgi:Tfp pilus assembly protein PilX